LFGQASTISELHRVVMIAFMHANLINGDDVRVVEMGRRFRFDRGSFNSRLSNHQWPLGSVEPFSELGYFKWTNCIRHDGRV
jgi:hypothetical protein